MPSILSVRIKRQLLAAWKWSLSLLKRDWELSDYPVTVREQKVDPDYSSRRFKQHRYIASIVNWADMTGGGETPQEARQELAKHFASAKLKKAKAKKPLPRPGANAPIEFASRERISFHPELETDFVHRVLGLDWAWISDESSLWDFHQDDTNGVLVAKIKEVYGVDVSDIESAKLCEILERIATQQRTPS
jgi:hypothetical protein